MNLWTIFVWVFSLLVGLGSAGLRVPLWKALIFWFVVVAIGHSIWGKALAA